MTVTEALNMAEGICQKGLLEYDRENKNHEIQLREAIIDIDKYIVNVYYIATEVSEMNEIERLQKYLLLVRRTVGWSAEEFGERIGVTRQTINNIEAGRNKLTKTQYIAMRSVLDAEIAAYPEETEILRLILDVLVDNPEKYKEEDREKLLAQANMVTPSILAGATSRKDVSKALIATAAGMGVFLSALGPIAVTAAGTGTWIAKTILGRKK